MGFSSDNSLVTNQLPRSIDFPEEDKLFKEELTLAFRRTIDAVNTKENALYMLQETGTFQQYFTANDPQTTRNVYRMVVNFGTLPNAGTKSVAHGISFTSAFCLTRLYAAASDQTGFQYISIPYASPTLANNIELNLDLNNVNITTGSNRTNFTNCTVVIEYTKN